MSYVQLLSFDYTAEQSFTGQRDPRVKLLLGLIISIVAITTSSTVLLLINLLLAIIVYTSVSSLSFLVRFIYSQKIVVALIFVFSFFIYPHLSVQQHAVLAGLLLIKYFSLIFAFSVFNRTTSPESLIDTLIKLKIPPNLAWAIAGAYRQGLFAITELSLVKLRIQNMYNVSTVSGRMRSHLQALLSTRLVISAYIRGILRANEYAESLYVRGWNGAHSTVTLHSSSFTKTDGIVAFLLCLYLLSVYLVQID